MNTKTAFKTDWTPEYLHEFDISATGKTYRVTTGMWVSVSRRPGLIAGKYEIRYGEYAKDGTLLITAEGPISRARRIKTIRETDIVCVHISTRPRDGGPT